MPCTWNGTRIRPRLTEFGDRETGVDEHRSLRALSSLRKFLSGHDTEREAGMNHIGPERLRFGYPALEDGVESDRLGEGHALLESGKGAAVEDRSGVCTV